VASSLTHYNHLPVFAVTACRPAMPEKVRAVHLNGFPAITLALPYNALVLPLLEGVEGGQRAELPICDILHHDGVNSNSISGS